MNEDQRMRLKRLIEALAHATRISILDVLRSGEECVCEIEAQLGYRQAHISQHLAVLRKAGLLRDRRTGWNVFYHVVQPESIPCSTPHARCWLLTTDNTKR
ncbi:MAG: winged helix-turn-helix transcriptional regulator, partial [Anaerolineae bacterium]|nr:winged helix-turn-helix transcriptional regulator [Anaerolineae bacterium]